VISAAYFVGHRADRAVSRRDLAVFVVPRIARAAIDGRSSAALLGATVELFRPTDWILS